MISLFASPSAGPSTDASDTTSRGSALVARLRRLATGGVVALVLGGLLSTGLTVGAQAADGPGARLEVQVTAGEDAVPFAQVEVLRPEGSRYVYATSGTTDASGTVVLTENYNLEAGVGYAISVERGTDDNGDFPAAGAGYSSGYMDGRSGETVDDFSASAAVVLGQGANALTVALSTGAAVHGDITDVDNLPFDGADRATAYRKSIDLLTGLPTWKYEGDTRISSSSEYDITGLRAGDYVVAFAQSAVPEMAQFVYGDGYASASAGPTTAITREAAGIVNGRFVAGQTITGQITAPASASVWNHDWDSSNVSLFVFPANPDGSFDQSNTENINGQVNEDGTFETAPLVAGDYYIYFDSLTEGMSGEWYNNAASPANGQTIAAGSVTDLVELGTGFDLTVTALLGSTPIDGARVDIRGTGLNNENYRDVLYTESNGTLVLPNLEADAYEIAVSSEEADFETRYATVNGEGSTTPGLVSGVDQPVSAGVTFPAPTFTTVTVVDPAGKPVAGAFVSAVAVENGVRKLDVTPAFSQGTTNKSGVTSFEVQPDTDYTLVTYGNSNSLYAQYLGGLSVSNDNLSDAKTYNSSDVQNVTFSLAAAGKISGVVKSTAKKPVAGVQVEAFEYNGSDWVSAGYGSTSKTGVYTIPVKPGSYKVAFSTQFSPSAAFVGDYNGLDLNIEALPTVYVGKNATATVNKTLTPGGSLTGTIAVAAGSDTYVTPIRIVGNQHTVMSRNGNYASSKGVFSLVGLPAGTYALSIDTDDRGDTYSAAGTGPLYKVAAGKVTKIAAKIVLPAATTVKTAVVQGSLLPSISVDNASYIHFEGSNGVHFASAQFSADGQYTVSLIPGEYNYEASVSNTAGVRYQPIRGTILVGPGVTTVDLTATVNTPLVFTGAPNLQVWSAQPGGVAFANAEWDYDRADASYQWLRDGVPIFGARDFYYFFKGGDVGSTISVRMTLDNGLHFSEEAYETIAATSAGVTVNEGPGITVSALSLSADRTSPGGVAKVAETNFTPSGWNLAFQWERDGEPIIGQTGSRYTFVPADVDATITATIAPYRLGYASSPTVTTSGLVGTRGAAATNVKKPVVTAVTKGVSAGGTKYTVTPGTWSIAGTTPAYAWYYDNEEGPFATTSSVTVAKDDPKQRAITVRVSATKQGIENSAPVVVLARKGTAYAEGSVFVSAGVDTIVETGSPVMLGHALSVQHELSIPLGNVTYSYVWQRQTGAKWAAIAKATARTYVPTIADTGKNLRVIVTASSPYYASKAFTVAAGTAVLDQRLQEERAGSVVLRGTGAVSSTVSASFLTDTPFAITGVAVAYQWGTLNGEAFVPIAKATAAKYVVPANLVGKSLMVRVTSTKAGFAPSVEYSPSTSVTTDITVLTDVSYTGQVGGAVRVGSKLTVKPAITDVTGTVRAYQWQIGAGDGFANIVGANATSYVPTADDVERDLRVIETISKAGSETVTSTPTQDNTWTVELGRTTVKVPAKVTTTAAAFTVVPGSVIPAATAVEYRWSVGGEAVEAGQSLQRIPAYAGKVIKVEIRSSLPGYETALQVLYPQLAAAPVQTSPFQFTDPRVGQPIELLEPDIVFPAGSSDTLGVKVQWFSGTVAIKGATTFGFVPTGDLAGKKLSVKTTLSSKGFATKVYTSVSKTVALGAGAENGIAVPEQSALAGSTISSVVLSPQPGFTVSYQWFRWSNDTPAVAIAKATKPSYTTLATDAGSYIELRVTYKRTGYEAKTYSAGGAVVYGRDDLIATVAPKITGTGAVGTPLTVSGGTWLNAPTLTYQWMRNEIPIPGATSATYTPQGDHLGDTIAVEVMAKRVGFDTRWETTNEIKVTVGAAPRNTANGEPKITGSAVTCSTLKVSTGSWDLDGLAFSYQWMRSSALGGGPIAGATSSTYVSTADDQGYKLYVMVTVTRDGYAEGSNKTALTAAFTPGADCSQN